MGVTLHFIPLNHIGKRVSFLGAPCLFSGFCARFRLFIWILRGCFGFYYRGRAIFYVVSSWYYRAAYGTGSGLCCCVLCYREACLCLAAVRLVPSCGYWLRLWLQYPWLNPIGRPHHGRR